MLGLVTDRRVASKQVIEARIARTGDRSLMPSTMATNRKPINVMYDQILGLIVTTWSLWFTILLRVLFF